MTDGSRPLLRKAILLPPSITESFEIVLGRAVDCRNKGEDIYIVQCDGHIGGCVANPVGFRRVCMQCRGIRDMALNDHMKGVSRVSLDRYHDTTPKTPIEDVTQLSVRELIDQGAKSTGLTFFRVDFERKGRAIRGASRRIHAFVFASYVKHSRSVFRCLLSIFDEVPTGRIELFNGRIVPSGAVIAAAQCAGLNYSLIEVWGGNKALVISDNQSFHDLEAQKTFLEGYISKDNSPDELGHAFFQLRRKGLPSNERSYIQRQAEGHLPIETQKTVVSIFLSSPDEMRIAGDQWFTPLSMDPAQFIADLKSVLSNDYSIIVRMHPNQSGDRTGELREIMKRIGALKKVRLIKPQDRASTYELIDKSHFVVTLGSTVGLEATYWGKPSILAGRSVWEDCGVSYNCSTVAEVKALLDQRAPALDRTNSLKVGSFYMHSDPAQSSLTFRDRKFYVNGKNYLPEKRRRGLVGIANRLIDAYLRARI